MKGLIRFSLVGLVALTLGLLFTSEAFAQRRGNQCNVQSSSATSSVSTAQVLQQQALLQAQLNAAAQPRTTTATATVSNGAPSRTAIAVTPPAPVGVFAPVQASAVQAVPVAVASRNRPLHNLLRPQRTVSRSTVKVDRRGNTTTSAFSRG